MEVYIWLTLLSIAVFIVIECFSMWLLKRKWGRWQQKDDEQMERIRLLDVELKRQNDLRIGFPPWDDLKAKE